MITVATESAATSAAQLTRHSVLHGRMSATVCMTCTLEHMRATTNVTSAFHCAGYAAVAQSRNTVSATISAAQLTRHNVLRGEA